MDKANLTDNYKVVFDYELADIDLKSLILLYQGVVGSSAIALYYTLAIESKVDSYSPHSFLLAILGSISIKKFMSLRRALESAKLLDSYKQNDEYIYRLYLPLSLEEYIKDPFLSSYSAGLLSSNYQLIKQRFASKDLVNYAMYDRISVTPGEIDNVLFNDTLVKLFSGVGKRKRAEIAEFDFKRVYDYLDKEIFLRKGPLSDKDVYDLSEIAIKNNLSPQSVAELIKKYYSYKTLSIDINAIKKLLNKSNVVIAPETTVITKPSDYKDYRVREFYRYKNGGAILSGEELFLEELTSKCGLKDEVMNVIIDYSLDKCDNRLNRRYVESIASTFVRKKIDSLESAYDILFGSSNIAESDLDEQIKKALEELERVKSETY